jgi:organic radical activating enzyme
MYSANLVESPSLLKVPIFSTKVDFCPDLIIEVTSICDRACSGCYANNIISNKSKLETLRKFPNLFLDPDSAEKLIVNLDSIPNTISFRGGEPTRHPMLSRIIKDTYKHTGAELYLETHGRWLLEQTDCELIDALKETQCIVKISFDKMHEITEAALRKMTCSLENARIQFVIAITEKDRTAFKVTRAKCHWIPEAKIVYQRKANNMSELPKPPMGVLNCTGTLAENLNAKAGYKGVK